MHNDLFRTEEEEGIESMIFIASPLPVESSMPAASASAECEVT